MSKLTLSVDSRIVARVKRYAKLSGISVSKMVEAYLDAVTSPAPMVTRDTPILRSVRGCIKKADRGEYRKHLETKWPYQ